ncbi:N-formyl peptide receptor 2-like [Xenopus tropicalis]|uniref:N-formyl peptide receptor 2-like n=1 Tax=Xenopus tropicalis TaxID=8364 RepID=A0A8J1JWZ6_XENTR|nr:N-formyl peptide receptor 2-like [Xenopus tropicalis]
MRIDASVRLDADVRPDASACALRPKGRQKQGVIAKSAVEMENYTHSPNITNFSTEESFHSGTLTQAMYITCFTITFILGTVGNGLVIWITGFKMKKTMTTIWFLNLAITDFSFCLILPLFITEKAMWAWENIIDYETYSVIMIAFGITTFVLYFLIPFLFITICYGLIAFKVFKSKRIPGSARTLKMIITTAFCFFFCWFLLYLLCIIEIAGPNIMRHHLEMTLYTLAQCLAFFNSCLNPIIYVFTGRDYKQILKKSIPFLLESAFIEKREPAHI